MGRPECRNFGFTLQKSTPVNTLLPALVKADDRRVSEDSPPEKVEGRWDPGRVAVGRVLPGTLGYLLLKIFPEL